ncbi:Scr1 family TA system antitoxin-like transcriptional regulator [Streptomyces fildesensis]|uniref:Scr1 family TA system antitoxin-like transcriptional regulator n=1 Tax=Streptomyces fildesensis TaxID=375757 RepID=UPI0018E058F1|nr:Scr1 family TA system antitoxin-like transcriptional regulator [Streptomyces fildesensis]
MIGAYLRTLRQDQNLTLIEAADLLGISAEHLERTEGGRRPLSQEQLEQLIDRFPSCGPHEQRMLRGLLAPTSAQFVGRGADPDMVLDCAPGWTARLRACERHASDIVTYSAGLVPAILRIDAYSEAFCADALTQQQRRLGPARALPRGDRRRVLVPLDECGLRQPVGGPCVMAAQLAHLLRASARGDAQIQIMPRMENLRLPAGFHSELRIRRRLLFVSEGVDASYFSGPAAKSAHGPYLRAAINGAHSVEHSRTLLDTARAAFQRRAEPSPTQEWRGPR